MKDILSVEQMHSMVKDAAPLVQSDEVSFRADLACHVCALVDTVDMLRAEVARLRAIEAAASEVSENALDMGLYYQTRVEDMDALRAALDAGES